MPRKRESHTVDPADIERNADGDERKVVFATRLNDLLYKKSMPQEKFAEKTDISTGAISSYRNGSTLPNAENLARIAETLNVSADYLLGLIDTPTTDVKLKAMSKYTGLDEKIIEFLNTEREIGSTEIINKLLKSREFWGIIGELQEIANNSRIITNDCIDGIKKKGATIEESAKMLERLYSSKKRLRELEWLNERKVGTRLARLECDDYFKTIVKAFVEGEELTDFYISTEEEQEYLEKDYGYKGKRGTE